MGRLSVLEMIVQMVKYEPQLFPKYMEERYILDEIKIPKTHEVSARTTQNTKFLIQKNAL